MNASSLLTLNPIIVNVELGLYGFLIVCIFVYVHVKFRKAGRDLQELRKDWIGAKSMHAGLVETAQQQLSRFAAESSSQSYAAVPTAVSADTRNQVAAMGRRGIPVSEIARSCGLPEGEIDVLLGMARMQRMEA